MQEKLTFAKRDGLGYLTFCPSNLGTTLRASVHIKIPLLSATKEFKQFCDERNIQARGKLRISTALPPPPQLPLLSLQGCVEFLAGSLPHWRGSRVQSACDSMRTCALSLPPPPPPPSPCGVCVSECFFVFF